VSEGSLLSLSSGKCQEIKLLENSKAEHSRTAIYCQSVNQQHCAWFQAPRRVMNIFSFSVAGICSF